MGTTTAARGADAPIGIFDSGVGGLTVARAVLDQLPHEAVRYIGDTAHSPYGPLPIAEVRRHSLAVMDDLVADGVKMLVVACNSASAASLRDARERYDVPVVEVVLPAVRRATAATRNGRIGVIGTQATITSGAYEDAFAAAPDISVTSAACPSFVDFVERGVTSGRQAVDDRQDLPGLLGDAAAGGLVRHLARQVDGVAVHDGAAHPGAGLDALDRHGKSSSKTSASCGWRVRPFAATDALTNNGAPDESRSENPGSGPMHQRGLPCRGRRPVRQAPQEKSIQ